MKLCGKGVWMTYSYHLQRGVEMAAATESTHIFVKVGHGPYYFPEAARYLVARTRALGFLPLAWVQLTPQLLPEAAVALRRAARHDFVGTVLYLPDERGFTPEAIEALEERLEAESISRDHLFLASSPLPLAAEPEAVKRLAKLCPAGWMPICRAAADRPVEQALELAFRSLGDLSLVWTEARPLYPVLAVRTVEGETLLPEAIIPWMQAVGEHGVDFFSLFDAASAVKAMWPIVQAVKLPCETLTHGPEVEEKDGNILVTQPVYIVVKPNDTVWSIIDRYGMSRQQFWEWNAHLWESRSLPRDPDYLQAGWRVRVK